MYQLALSDCFFSFSFFLSEVDDENNPYPLRELVCAVGLLPYSGPIRLGSTWQGFAWWVGNNKLDLGVAVPQPSSPPPERLSFFLRVRGTMMRLYLFSHVSYTYSVRRCLSILSYLLYLRVCVLLTSNSSPFLVHCWKA